MSLIAILEQQPSHNQRIVAVTLLLGLLAGMGILAIQFLPWIMHVQHDWRDQASTQLAKARGWAGNADAVLERKQSFRSAEIWQQLYVPHDGLSASAAIQRDVSSILNSVGATGLNIEEFDEATKAGLSSHGVRATASFTADQLRTLFEQLRNHSPYLRMQRIQVTAPQIEAHYQNPILLVVLDIVGYSVADAPTTTRIKS